METIDTNIPVPTKESKYAVLDKLAVGDSVLIAVPRSSSLSKTISNLQKKTGKRFQRQKVEGGVRVWRIEGIVARRREWQRTNRLIMKWKPPPTSRARSLPCHD